MSEAISFGGGVNSTAMTIMLVNKGWHGPIVFADTGCEWPETYEYMEMFEEDWLVQRGLEITRVGGEYRRKRNADGSLIEYCERHRMIPLAGVRWCTVEYKVKPINKWCEEHSVETQLLGIASDEARRQPTRSRPLVDRNITRKGCAIIIEKEGLPVPRKSGCWLCPFQPQQLWRELRLHHPELFERAARLEETVSERTGRRANLDPSGKRTVRERAITIDQQGTLFDDWEYYKPCMCGV